ncbi:MAG: glycosyltransferase family 39 protein [Candidatus Moranbacteria bacterium]|nr:glycosyltransferase family 39 protein [Candidatus Moranbacteria bacterium]
MHVPNQSAVRLMSLACLVVILSLALFLRAYNIENIPTGLYPDEAVNATDALHALKTHHFKLFYENNQGREGLFINLQALALGVLGVSVFALKFWSIVFGTLTVLGMYLFAKEIWQKRSIALITAYFTAISFWAINFSRIGFRAIMVPFILSFSFYFFFRGLRTKSFISFALSGFIFALGLHTYIAFRLTPLILIFFLIGLMLSYENFLKLYWKHALTFIFFAFIAAVPMFFDFSAHPEHFNSRAAHVSIFSPEINHGNFWGTLTKTLGLSLIKYNFVGDQNWRHNYPPYAILDPITGIAFLVGFLYLIPRTVKLLVRRLRDKDRNKELALNFLFIGWFFTMLMPEFLTDEGLPHALRAIGTIPVVFLIASTPFLWIGERLRSAQPGMKVIILSFIAFTLIGTGVFNGVKYLIFYANNPKQHEAFNENYKNMAQYLLALPVEVKKYVYVSSGGILPENNLPIAAQPITFFTYRKDINLSFILPNADAPEGTLNIQAPSTIVLMNNDEDFISSVQTQFPHTVQETVDLHPGFKSEFRVLHVVQ